MCLCSVMARGRIGADLILRVAQRVRRSEDSNEHPEAAAPFAAAVPVRSSSSLYRCRCGSAGASPNTADGGFSPAAVIFFCRGPFGPGIQAITGFLLLPTFVCRWHLQLQLDRCCIFFVSGFPPAGSLALQSCWTDIGSCKHQGA